MFDLKQHLIDNGLDTGLFHEDYKTPVMWRRPRQHEINAWLEDHIDVTHWAAVDDYESYEGIAKPNVVLVDIDNGIMLNDYKKLLKILTEDKHE